MITRHSKPPRLDRALARALGCFAYSTTNPPMVLTMGPLTGFGASEPGSGGNPNFWVYSSTDTIATVKAANYITNAQALGMRVGDVIFVYDQTTPALSLAFVTAVASTGSTLDTTPLTAT